MGGPGYRFGDETKGSPHKFDKPGKLAMANSGPGTNGCQFFITVAPTPWLTGNHTIFGEVVEGQEIVTKISLVPRGGQDKPKKPVVLESVVIERVALRRRALSHPRKRPSPRFCSATFTSSLSGTRPRRRNLPPRLRASGEPSSPPRPRPISRSVLPHCNRVATRAARTHPLRSLTPV
jgi:hypothetical protein